MLPFRPSQLFVVGGVGRETRARLQIWLNEYIPRCSMQTHISYRVFLKWVEGQQQPERRNTYLTASAGHHHRHGDCSMRTQAFLALFLTSFTCVHSIAVSHNTLEYKAPLKKSPAADGTCAESAEELTGPS